MNESMILREAKIICQESNLFYVPSLIALMMMVMMIYLFVCFVALRHSQQLWPWRDGQFT